MKIINDFSGFGIPYILMNIMSCHGFSESTISTVILTCHSSLLPYYFSKGFFVEKEEGEFENIPEQVLNKINAVPLHDEDIILMCKAEIP